jgi:hypothetical protein
VLVQVHEAVAHQPLFQGHARDCFVELERLHCDWLQHLAEKVEQLVGLSQQTVEVRLHNCHAGIEALESLLPQHFQDLLLHHVLVHCL